MRTPIVILGAARSGTKILREVLAASRDIRAVPYDVPYIWSYGNERHGDDALDRQHANQKTIAFIRLQLARLAGIHPGEDYVLLEKTVGNTLRVPFVDAVLPNARYIHLTRDGRAVVESAMRMWCAPPDYGALVTKLRALPLASWSYALWFCANFIKGLASRRMGGRVWGPRYPGIEQDLHTLPLEEICARQWAASVRAASNALSMLPSERVFAIRYEDFVSDPKHLEELVAFLNLEDRQSVRDRYHRLVNSDNLDKWRQVLTEEQVARIVATAAPELRRLAYIEAEGL